MCRAAGVSHSEFGLINELGEYVLTHSQKPLLIQTTLTTLLRDWQFQSRAPGMPSALVQVTLRPRGLPVHVIRREARPTCASL